MKFQTIRDRIEESTKPFLFRLSAGRTVRVPHPDSIIVGRRVVVVMDDHEVLRTFDPLHFVSLEEWPNGRKHKVTA